MGIYNILFMVKKGLIPKEMTNKVNLLFYYPQIDCPKKVKKGIQTSIRCSSPISLVFSGLSGFVGMRIAE